MFFSGIAGCFISGVALAQSRDAATDPTFLWGMVGSAALAIGGWFLRGIHNRLSLVEHDNKNIWAAVALARQTVAENHHTKAEMVIYHEQVERATREHRERVEHSLQAMNARLDQLFSTPRNG